MDAKRIVFSRSSPAAAVPQALISRSALLHNVKVLRAHLRDSTRLCAIIKADAYGHSAAIVADTLTNFTSGPVEGPAVDSLAVACFDEAAALGAQDAPIYVLRPVESHTVTDQREAIAHAIREGWTITIISASAAADVARIATSCSRRALIQVMIDTGMGREGAPVHSLNWLLSAIESLPSLKLSALCTHFVASEDARNEITAQQCRLFESVTADAARRNPRLIRHAANSGACFFHPESHYDMVRPGLALLGIDPTGKPSVDRHLRPALRWTAPLLMIRDIPMGTSIGYNHTWKAPSATRIGLVPVGYADGYQRALSNQCSMMLRGKAVPVVGRVSMDYVTIDLSSCPQATPGDEVTILDCDPLSPASVYRLAEAANSIPYEIFTRIGNRIPRIAVDPSDVESSEPEVGHPTPRTMVFPRVLRSPTL